MRPLVMGMCSSIHLVISSVMTKRKFGLASPPAQHPNSAAPARVVAPTPKKRRRVRVLGRLSPSLFMCLSSFREPPQRRCSPRTLGGALQFFEGLVVGL